MEVRRLVTVLAEVPLPVAVRIALCSPVEAPEPFPEEVAVLGTLRRKPAADEPVPLFVALRRTFLTPTATEFVVA
jgi:hypothetical protein